MKRLFTLIFLGILLINTACSTPPAPAATQTPQPTQTPIPKLFTGRLFFDMNGSGLQDESTFVYDPERLADLRQPLQPDLDKAIKEYVAAHPEMKKGDLVTLPEPALTGYQVCIEKDCVKSGLDGSFSILNSTNEDKAKIRIIDPYADNPLFAMRYINKWKGSIVIKAYVNIGVQVKEQHLNDTNLIQITNGFEMKIEGKNDIGVMQGFVLFPFSQNDISNLQMIIGFDHDPSETAMDYEGRVIPCKEYNDCKNMNKPIALDLNGIGNDHTGIDYGYYGSPEKFKNFLYAAKSGFVQNRVEKGNIDILEFIGQRFGSSPQPLINYGHASTKLVENLKYVYPGQIIGIMGNSGTAKDWTHLHFEIQYGNPINNVHIGSSKDFFAQIDLKNIIKGFNEISVWTVFNLPQFPLVG